MDPELESWLLARIDGDGRKFGHGYQASVILVASPIGDIVVKSPHRRFPFGRIARASVRREAGIYAQLENVPGIPKCHGLAAEQHLALDHIAGHSLRDRMPAGRDEFFARLLVTIQAMHAAGVAHGDLKRKNNVLVGPDERPYIIDFGIARADGPGLIARLLFNWFRQLDLNAWVKLKHGGRPAALPAADAAIHRPLLLEHLARMVRIPWQFLTLRRPRQRWRQARLRGKGD
jgi:predicted Ser/Thr protein kinase